MFYCKRHHHGLWLQLIYQIVTLTFHAAIFVVALLGIVLFGLPLVNDYKGVIEQEISDFVGNKIVIGKVRANVQDGLPSWILDDVHLIEANGDSPIHIKQLTMTMDWAESWRTLRPQPDTISLDGVELVLTQSPHNDIPDVKGLTFPLPGQKNTILKNERNTPIRVKVNNGFVHWLDGKPQHAISLEQLKFDGEFGTDKLVLQASAHFPQTIGKQFGVDAVLTRSGEEWVGDLHTHADIQQLAQLPLSRLESIGLTSGGVQLEANVQLRANQPPYVKGAGRLTDWVLKGKPNIPALQGLNADFTADNQHGTLNIAVDNSALNYPEWFEKPIAIETLRTKVDWKSAATGWVFKLNQFNFKNRDVTAHGTGQFSLPKHAKPDLNLDIRFATNRVVDNVRQYIPALIVDGTEEWLKTAIVKGFVPQGEFVFKGDPADFPFTNGKGVFDIRFDVEQGILAYQPDWPVANEVKGELRFHNAGMHGTVKSARIMDLDVLSGKVDIPDMLGESHLLLDVQTKGKLKAHMDYLQSAPIGRHLHDFMQIARFYGDSKLDTKVDVPLDAPVFKRKGVSVAGRLNLLGNAFALPEYDQRFENMQGLVEFDQVGVTTQAIQTQYRGQPMQIRAKTFPDQQRIEVALTQVNQAAAFLPSALNGLAPYIQGSTPIQTLVILPAFTFNGGKANAKLQLHAKSQLTGLTIPLPAPLGKAATESKPFNLELTIPFDTSQAWGLQANFNDVVRVKAALPQQSEKRATIGIGIQEVATVPEKGIALAGSLSQVNVLDWLALGELAQGNTQPSMQKMALHAALHTADLRLGEYSLGQTDITLSSDSVLNAQVRNAHMTIDAMLPVHAPANGSVNVALNRLDLAQLANGAMPSQSKSESQAQNPLLPSDVPALALTCHQCRYADTLIEKLELSSSKRNKILNLDKFVLKTPHWVIQSANGQWVPTASGSQTQMNVVARIPELSAVSASAENYIQGALKTSTQLSWQGAPYELDIKKITGKAALDMGKGRLIAKNVGMARVIGLLDVARLPRQFKTGFKDMRGQGLVFEGIKGNLRFEQGHFTTHDLYINAQPLLARLDGSMNLLDETLNLNLALLPDWRSALPWVGAAMGGVGGGVAVLVFNEAMKRPVEQKLKSNVALRYKITGKLTDPQIVVPNKKPTDVLTWCEDSEQKMLNPQCQ